MERGQSPPLLARPPEGLRFAKIQNGCEIGDSRIVDKFVTTQALDFNKV
jgi:hypothetical protein